MTLKYHTQMCEFQDNSISFRKTTTRNDTGWFFISQRMNCPCIFLLRRFCIAFYHSKQVPSVLDW